MRTMYFKMHVEDIGLVDCVSVEPIQSLDWRDHPEEEPELNQFELMGYSHEASIVLQDCYESTKALWECFADAFENFSRTIMKPIEDAFYELFDSCYVEKDVKHFDGVYSKPKMMEYFKMQPNVCNLNNKIRKARNLL